MCVCERERERERVYTYIRYSEFHRAMKDTIREKEWRTQINTEYFTDTK